MCRRFTYKDDYHSMIGVKKKKETAFIFCSLQVHSRVPFTQYVLIPWQTNQLYLERSAFFTYYKIHVLLEIKRACK